MQWVAVVIGAIILLPLAIFLFRRLAGLLSLLLGVIGILCLIAKQYVAGAVMLLAAFLIGKLGPSGHGADDL